MIRLYQLLLIIVLCSAEPQPIPSAPPCEGGNCHLDLDAENVGSNFEIAEDPIHRYTKQIVVNMKKQNVACPTEKVKIIFRNIQRRIYSIDQDRIQKGLFHIIMEQDPKNIIRIYCETNIQPDLEKVMKNLRNIKVRLHTKILEDVIEEEDQFDVIKGYHLGKTHHHGIKHTVKAVSRRYYFPKIYEQVRRYINQCDICQQARGGRNHIPIVSGITETSWKPFGC